MMDIDVMIDKILAADPDIENDDLKLKNKNVALNNKDLDDENNDLIKKQQFEDIEEDGLARDKDHIAKIVNKYLKPQNPSLTKKNDVNDPSNKDLDDKNKAIEDVDRAIDSVVTERGVTQGDQDRMEAAIDLYGLSDVLQSIVEICYLKSEHISTNWQDDNTAKEWEKAARLIDTCSSKTRSLLIAQ